MEQSGLARALPEAQIRFRRPGSYLELLENVQIHGYHLMLAAGRTLPPGEIAADWFANVYVPAVTAIRQEGLECACPGGTESDLFLCAYQRRRDIVASRGCLPLEDIARDWSAHSHDGTSRSPRRLLRPRPN
jgi:hypothetical protein